MNRLTTVIILVALLTLLLAGCAQIEGETKSAAADNYSARDNYSTTDNSRSAPAPPVTAMPPETGTDLPAAQSSRPVTVIYPLPELVASEAIEIRGKTRPGNKIFIEGVEVLPGPGGEFSLQHYLKVGKNEISVVTLGKEKILDTQKIAIERRPLPPSLTVIAPEKSDSEYLTITGQTDRGCVVYANSTPVRPDREGGFTSTVQLNEGTNRIKITSTNREGGTAVVEKTVSFTPPAPRLEVIIPDESKSKQVTISGITDTNAILVLFVNEVRTNINQQNGIFSGAISLEDGVNTVTVTAINKWGKKKTVSGNIFYTSPL
ncbi:MAG: hypothetical protein ACOY30_11655 [Bacillota bacterium]